MVCASALSFFDGKVCAVQEPSIIMISIIMIIMYVSAVTETASENLG